MDSRFSADDLPTLGSSRTAAAVAPPDLAHTPPFLIGSLEVRPATREVIRKNHREILEPKPMQVLIVLADARGMILSRDDLIERCWHGRAISDDAINRVLSILRRVGRSFDAFHIETIIKVGFRLVPLGGHVQGPDATTEPTGEIPARKWPFVSRRAMIGAGASAVVAAVGGGWLIFDARSTATANRIAVLPFANLSGDPAQAYFSDGIAEELRVDLSRAGMQVIGRTSSNAVRNMDVRTAAARLGVANVLTGSVRRSPGTIRIDAVLLRGSDGVERWSQSYDRAPGDAIMIQTDIAEKVAEALSIALSKEGRAALTLGGTTVPAAQDLVLQTIRDASDDEAGLDRKIALLDSALSLDPNYAEAYSRKAWLLAVKAGRYALTPDNVRRALTNALAIADHAMAIAPKMALGYTVRSQIYQEQLRMAAAIADDRQAISMPDANSEVFRGYASILWQVGRFQEALQIQAKSIELDPLNPAGYGGRATILYFARRYSEAAADARRSLAVAPDQVWNRSILGNALLAMGKLPEAAIEFAKLDRTEILRIVGETVIAARSGHRKEAFNKLQSLRHRYADADHYHYAVICAQLGMVDDTIEELESAWASRSSGLSSMRVDPLLDPVRSDRRFASIQQRVFQTA